jgi:U3 small nucleolar RNA-associated protein 11
MSSFSKNIIPRREHRERHQPDQRVAKHGLLEKKRDYKLRAKDANRKAYRLKLLREKAAFRNPDEFYHAMEHAAPTKNGRVRKARDPNVAENHHTADGAVRRLVETQDRAYVQMKRTRERSRIESIKESLHFLDAAAVDESRKHTVFVGDDDDDDDTDLADRHPPSAESETLHRVSESLGGFSDKGGQVIDDDDPVDDDSTSPRVSRTDGKLTRRARKQSRKAYEELSQRLDRATRLTSALEDMSLRHHLLSKGARRKVKPGDAAAGILPVFKWRKQRSR